MRDQQVTPDVQDTLVVIVGAGMAGLTAAVALHEAGVPVRVYEASNGVGGRIRSDYRPDGFVIDRGFQVLLDAYPAAKRWIDYDAMRARPFDAGALLWTGKRLVPLADPLRHPSALVRDLSTSLFPASDKARLARLAAFAAMAPWQSANAAATALGNDVSGSEFLWSRGFSERFVDRFARPFWGGITLDRHLAGSAGPLLFTLKMFLHGRAVLPSTGVGAMPAQLRSRLPADAVRLNSSVTAIVTEGRRATGIRVGDETVNADAIIVATDPPAAAGLTGVRILPTAERGSPTITVFLAGRRNPGTGPRLVLDATRRMTINSLAPLSEAQPAYTPPGQYLLAAEVIGEAAADRDVESLAATARREAALMLGHAPEDWRVLETVVVPYSQFAQPPGIYRRLPGNVTPIRGLYLASEATVDSSYNGAMTSGETVAGIVRRDLAFPREH
ncbi:MAG: NAD(P)/FAD-dependent oxidoreductase [Thermomicrobiales bacterium]